MNEWLQKNLCELGDGRFRQQYLVEWPEPKGDVVAAYEFYEQEATKRETWVNGRLRNRDKLSCRYQELNPKFIKEYNTFVAINGEITTFYKLHRYAAFRHGCKFKNLQEYGMTQP
jgi:hypothetical protein